MVKLESSFSQPYSKAMGKLFSCLYAAISGVLAGTLAAAFLATLSWVTEMRVMHPNLVYFLPFAGLLIGGIYALYGKEISPETGLIIDEIHDPKKNTPLKMSPIIFVTASLTHLFGGSTGREGAIVQMSGSLSDQASKIFKLKGKDRSLLLTSALSAGFSAALGTPWAGAIFGLELVKGSSFHWIKLFSCLISSFVAFGIATLLSDEHLQFSEINLIHFSVYQIFIIFLAAVLFGLATRFFINSTHFIENFYLRYLKNNYLKPMLGGFALVFIFKCFSLESFEGLGIETLTSSFQEPIPRFIFIIKILVTAITLGSGFKGGEFIPLVYIGATLGNAIAQTTGLPLDLLAGLGFVSVFAAASKTPIASTVMAIELFGWKIAPLLILSILVAERVSNTPSIYKKSTR